MKKRNIDFKYNFNVIKIEKEDYGFKIISDNETILCDKLIIATGSKAMPKSGSDGFGYEIAKKFNINVNKVLPSLVSLNTSENFLKDWSGIRTDAKVSLFINDKYVNSEIGEIQLTDNGVSGICVFNLSGKAIRSFEEGKNVFLSINFAPFIEDFYHFFEERSNIINNQNIKELCESLFNYKLSKKEENMKKI